MTVVALDRSAASARRLRAAPSRAIEGAPTRWPVARPRLVRRLAEASSVALVVAPAGYGKTTLLRQWDEHDTRRFTWVTAGRHGFDDAAATRAALAECARFGDRSVLVIDDAHGLSAEAREALAHAVRRPGREHVIAVSSRAEPGIRVGRLRAEERLVELRARELAMTEAEAAAVLRRAGLDDPGCVTALYRRTEGWAAGLRLAAAAVRDAPEAAAAVAAFAGDDRFVAEYLREELLDALSPDEVAFLTGASILDALSAPLCDAVLERHDSGEVLRRLARANVMVSAVDRSDEHFRCHPLLADLLRRELRRSAPEQALGGHRRASAFHERRGEVEEAIEHAIAARDLERSGRLLWSAAAGHALGGRAEALEGWLHRFRADEIAASPALALTAAVGRVMLGDRDGAERWVDAAERGHGTACVERRRSMAAARFALRAAVARDGLGAMAGDARRAYELDAGDRAWQALACLLEGAAAKLTGDAQRARAALEEGVRRSAPDAPVPRALCLAQLALPGLLGADIDEGIALAARARLVLDQAGLDDCPACALVFAVSALARAQGGGVNGARHDAPAARRLLERQPGPAPWYEAETLIALARAELRLSDATQARDLLAEAARIVRRSPESTVLRTWIDEAWARVDAFAEGGLAGRSTLTTAELRVLRFLPSHLSFREIALRLNVSANTVKTHAHAVYRKLDATSRSEAVGRARAIGLVDGR